MRNCNASCTSGAPGAAGGRTGDCIGLVGGVWKGLRGAGSGELAPNSGGFCSAAAWPPEQRLAARCAARACSAGRSHAAMHAAAAAATCGRASNPVTRIGLPAQ